MKKSDNAYPAYWNELAEKIKDEAGWRCVRCGHPHESPKERIPCDDKCDLVRHPEIAYVATMVEDKSLHLFRNQYGLWPSQRQRVLTVHHMDGDKSNSAWWNLVPLCQVCHLYIQGTVTLSQVYYLEHSDWFKPYAAGWYAHTYLGLDMTREEVEGRIEELLTMERQI